MAKKKRDTPYYLDAFRKRCLPTPKPCPCCGEGRPEQYRTKPGSTLVDFRGLYTGPMGDGAQGIKCMTCGLRMRESLPEYKPQKCRDMTWKQFEQWMLTQAIERWNRRAHEES